uniref:Uncharacterized protein n=1 Tax=Triticum urartu TaxID=4572 RepID=A0A8R7QDS9_TRIUA
MVVVVAVVTTVQAASIVVATVPRPRGAITVPGVVTVGARAPAAPAVAPPGPMQVPIQPLPEVPANLLDMHEVAVPSTVAVVLLELPAGGLPEVGDGRELSNDGAARVEPPLQRLERLGGLVLLPELHVDVADEVVGEVVADVQVLDLAVLAELVEDVLVEVLEVALDLDGVDGVALRVHARGDHVGALVHVAEQQRGRDGRLVVQAGAAVAVPARADLEVERAVHAVLLRAEDRREVLGHGAAPRIRAPAEKLEISALPSHESQITHTRLQPRLTDKHSKEGEQELVMSRYCKQLIPIPVEPSKSAGT